MNYVERSSANIVRDEVAHIDRMILQMQDKINDMAAATPPGTPGAPDYAPLTTLYDDLYNARPSLTTNPSTAEIRDVQRKIKTWTNTAASRFNARLRPFTPVAGRLIPNTLYTGTNEPTRAAFAELKSSTGLTNLVESPDDQIIGLISSRPHTARQTADEAKNEVIDFHAPNSLKSRPTRFRSLVYPLVGGAGTNAVSLLKEKMLLNFFLPFISNIPQYFLLSIWIF